MSNLDPYARRPEWPAWKREHIGEFADNGSWSAETQCLMAFVDAVDSGALAKPKAVQAPPKPVKPSKPKPALPELSEAERKALLDKLEAFEESAWRLRWQIAFGDNSPETAAERKATMARLAEVERLLEPAVPFKAVDGLAHKGILGLLHMVGALADVVKEQLAGLRRDVASIASDTVDSERLAALEARVGELSGDIDRLGAVESRVGELSGDIDRLGTIESRVAELVALVGDGGDFGQRIATLEGRVSERANEATVDPSLYERLAVLEKSVIDLDFRSDAGNLGERIAVIEAASFGDRLAALESDLAEVKAGTTALRYKGVWSKDTAYTTGNMTTFGGSLWHANQPNKAVTPGSNSYSWTLCVKRGSSGGRA